MKVLLTWDNSTFRECSPLRIRSSFKRFLHCGSKVLGVVKSPRCFVLKWEKPRVGFPPALFQFFVPRYRFYRHPLSRSSMLPFSRISKALQRYPRVFNKKWNSFRKINLKTSLIVSIVRTATSVTKIIFVKYKFLVFVLKRKMLISLSHQFVFGQVNSKSHSFFFG